MSRIFFTLIFVLFFQSSFAAIAGLRDSVGRSLTHSAKSALEGPASEGAELPQLDLEWASRGGTGAHVGDEIEFVVKAKPEDLPEVPTLDLSMAEKALSESGWQVVGSVGEPAGEKAKKDRVVKFLAYPLRAGQLVLPSLILKTSEGMPIALTRPFALEVQSAISPKDPKPDKSEPDEPPVSLDFPMWTVVTSSILGLLIFTAVIYGLIYLWRKKKPRSVSIAEPSLSEDAAALLALAQLEKSKCLERGEYKIFYFGISEILKEYIDKRFQFDALECTTAEMLNSLRGKTEVENISSLFEKLDRVKFTDYIPDNHEGADLLEKGREFVRKTKRQPEPLILPQEATTHAPS